MESRKKKIAIKNGKLKKGRRKQMRATEKERKIQGKKG